MASSYTDIGTELMTTGENAGNWGTKTNTNLQILEEALRGYVAQSIAGGTQTTALTYTDGTVGDAARNMIIALTGTITGNQTITVPAVEKMWIIDNQTSGAYTVNIKVSGQTGVTWGASDKGTKILYGNGTDVVDTDIGGVGAYDLNGATLTLDLDGDTDITADTDDQIDIRIAGADDFQFTANTFTAQAGSTIAAQALTATTVTASGIVKTDDTTEATSTTDGSLQTDGGLSVAKDAVLGDDLKLLSDSAVLSFGADSDTTLTHTDGTGLTLNSTNKLLFRDTGLYINSSTDGQLDLVADTEIQIAATTIDINGAIAMDGAITGATNITLSGELDAATLDISGNADIDGTLEADAITINGTAIGSIYGAVAGSSSIVTTGALDSGSITSGFGTIDTGSSAITTTGLISGGSLDIDNVLINGTTIGHTDDTDLLTVADGLLTVAGEISVTTLDIGGTNVTTTAAEINLIDGGASTGTTAVADADGILTNDGGTMRLTTAATFKTYFTSGVSSAADDLTVGDDAVNLTTSSGNITIDAAANNTDIIFKGTDATADITMLTLDGSEAGAATFNDKVIATELDISGNMDIDGTSNLDAVDIDGAVQLDATLTIGANDQGYDVILYGDTASANVTWDTSADDLIFNGAAGLIVPDGQFTLGSTAVSSTAAELNLVDGITAGTISASLAVIVDSNKDITGFRNVTLTGELDSATLDVSGNADIDGTTNLDAVDIDGAVQLDATLTIGANDQGYDVILYGDTASANLTWDTSVDDLILNGAARIVVPDGQLVLGSTAVSSTAAELNLLDNVSGLVQADLTKLAAVDSTAAELNIVDGGTSATSTTVADADRVVLNDNGTMVQVAMTDIKTYIGGGTSWQAVKTGDFTAAAGQGVFVNTTSAAITITLPAGTIGDEVSIIDYAGTFDSNNCTVAANGSEKIHASTDDLTVATERAGFTLVFTDSTQGWLLKDK